MVIGAAAERQRATQRGEACAIMTNVTVVLRPAGSGLPGRHQAKCLARPHRPTLRPSKGGPGSCSYFFFFFADFLAFLRFAT